MRSTVFRAMFYSQMEEKNPIEIADIDSETFEELMRYIYIDQITFNDAQRLVSLLHAAEKYQVTKLTDTCHAALLQVMTSDNVCFIFSNAHFLGVTSLQEEALELIAEESGDVLNLEGWTNLRLEDVCVVLDSLDITASEVIVFRAAMLWASSTCELQSLAVTPENQRRVLGEAFYNIRFVDMSANEFSRIFCSTNVLSCEEQLAFLKFMATGTDPLPMKFKSEKRNRKGTIIKFKEPKSNTMAFVEDGEVSISIITSKKEIEFTVTKLTIITPRKLYSNCLQCKTRKLFTNQVTDEVFVYIEYDGKRQEHPVHIGTNAIELDPPLLLRSIPNVLYGYGTRLDRFEIQISVLTYSCHCCNGRCPLVLGDVQRKDEVDEYNSISFRYKGPFIATKLTIKK